MFFIEILKFNPVCLFEDYEWNHNRNEDDPAFDDFVLWDAIEAKKLELYPEGSLLIRAIRLWRRSMTSFGA